MRAGIARDARHQTIAARGQQGVVEGFVNLAQRGQTGGGAALTLHFGQNFFHPAQGLVIPALQGLDNAGPFQSAAQAIAVFNLPRRKMPNELGLLRQTRDQTLLQQALQGFAHRPPADAEMFGDLGFTDGIAGRKGAVQQALLDIGDGLGAVRLDLRQGGLLMFLSHEVDLRRRNVNISGRGRTFFPPVPAGTINPAPDSR